MYKKVFSLLSIIVPCFLLFGCKETQEEVKEKAGYSYETYDLSGQKSQQHLIKEPEKVLVIGEKNAERLLSFDLGEKIASLAYLETVDNEKIKDIPILSKEWPSKEAVLELKPDLIYGISTVFQDDRLGDFSFWNKQGIGIGTTSNYQIGVSPEQFFDEIKELGEIFNIEDQTNQFIDEEKESITKVIDDSKGKLTKDSVLFIASDGRGNYYYYPENYHLVDDIMLDLKANYLDLGDELITLSHESVIDLNPDRIIFTSFMGDEKKQEKDPWLTHSSLSQVKAIKNEQVLEVSYDDVIRGNENLGETYQVISDFLMDTPHE